MKTRTLHFGITALLLAAFAFAQNPPAPPAATSTAANDPAGKLIEQARKANSEGKPDEARQHIQKAIDMAPEPAKLEAMRTMAISYAFERKASDAAKYEEPVFEAQ